MKRTRTSKSWMSEHISDSFVKQAQKDGYRSRAAYKLIEIDEKYNLFKENMVIVDLGSAPGSWSQLAANKIGMKGKVIALDLLEMQPVKKVEFIQGDFRDNKVLIEIEKKLNNLEVDLVISDMAPNISGIKVVDQSAAIYLNELALDFSCNWLKPNGHLLVKSFIGADFDSFVDSVKPFFKKVIRVKPSSSRSRSSEIFVLGYEKVNT
jgi:23S rRNA (uridine2552-2'-O)-methyltransferase|tara:strand:- start:198 stop:821 length:624 start_codon:yes stop_codon:yes gene_type:complete